MSSDLSKLRSARKVGQEKTTARRVEWRAVVGDDKEQERVEVV